MKNKLFTLVIFTFLLTACQSDLQRFGQAYQETQSFENLSKAVDLIELGSDTAFVRSVLGEPIDMGFDFRYLVDSTGPNGCVIGAVFHINDEGKIDDKWIDEICE